VFIKARHLSPLWYTIYAAVGTVLQGAALVVIVLWGLPRLNIYIPVWGLAILMVLLLIYSFYTYRTGRAALLMKPLVAPETIIDSEGIVATPLDPNGYVRVKGELWKATCESRLKVGDEIIVVGIEGIKLIVVRKDRSFFTRHKELTRLRGF
jgi:membrane protein implicated in regulation of membrane protease activity